MLPGPQADLAKETLKNPYNFDFLTMGQEAGERDLESALMNQLKQPQDQPSIGILLCKTPNRVTVEYALENIASPLGVAEYRVLRAVPDDLKGELPSIEELERELGASVEV